MHFCKIFHRDLKPHNILINKSFEIKIADFGLARTFSNDNRHYSQDVVTLWYRAPEILIGSTEYSSSIDMWSVGCIFFELLTRRVLFQSNGAVPQLVEIFKRLGTPSLQDNPQLKNLNIDLELTPGQLFEDYLKTFHLNFLEIDLLKKLITLSPTNRICASQALSHPYFDDML